MTTLLELRTHLRSAEQEYRTASSTMDGSNTDLIVKKQLLKNARFEYHEALADAHEEQIAFDKEVKEWIDTPDVGLEVIAK